MDSSLESILSQYVALWPKGIRRKTVVTKWEFRPGQMLLGERGAMQLDSIDVEAGENNVLKYNIDVIAKRFCQVECVCSHLGDTALSRSVHVFQEKFYRSKALYVRCTSPWLGGLLLINANKERRKSAGNQHSNTI